MASRARPRARPKPPRGSTAVARVRVERAPWPRAPVDLVEDPHAHIVCRVCGRIQVVELTELDRHFLTRLAEDHPEGWAVDGIAYSLTGSCRRCREGPPS